MCVCYVLSYKSPDYIRTTSLLHALAGCKGVRVVTACNTSTGLWRYIETCRALWRVRKCERPDVYILGFRGHEIFWLVRRVARHNPLVFDALMSPTAAMESEGKLGGAGRVLAPIIGHFESNLLHESDVVLTDTALHAGFYARRFGLRRSKIACIPVGAVEDAPSQTKSRRCELDKTFNVLFYGSFLPLHGINVIIHAASKLVDLPIRFDFVGGGRKQQRRLYDLCASMGVTRFTYRRWIPFKDLLGVDIQRANLCLGGPFGGTPQARRVVTGKASQCLALGKATVLGKIDEDYGFVDRENCLLVDQNSSDGLASSIRWAFEHRAVLNDIGVAGRQLYQSRLSVRIIRERLQVILDGIAHEQKIG